MLTVRGERIPFRCHDAEAKNYVKVGNYLYNTCLKCLSVSIGLLNLVDPLSLVDNGRTLEQAKEALQEVETFKRYICKTELETLEATIAKLTKENEILRELLDRPNASGAKFSYQEIKRALA